MQIKKFDSINIIPFIDVMLVLLTTVLMTATFVVRGEIDVQLPSAKGENPSPSAPKPIILAIKESGALYLDDSPITISELQDKLVNTPRTTPIQLHTDKKAPFEHFVEVLAPLKAQGFDALSIMTLNP